MIDALLDPFIVTVPESPSPEEAQSFLNRLISWNSSANQSDFRLLVAEWYMKPMWENGQIPTFEKLKSLCKGLAPEIYNAQDLQRIVAKILDQYLENHMPISGKGLLLDDTSTKVEPDHINSRLHSSVDRAFVEVLATCALHQEISSEGVPNCIITDSAKSDALSGTFKIDYADLAEHNGMTFPSQVNNEWVVVDDVESLLAMLDGECVTLEQAVEKASDEFKGDLVFLPRAYDSARDYQQYQQTQKAYHALKVLGEVCRMYRGNQLGRLDIAAAIKERLGRKSYAPDVAESIRNGPKGNFDVTHNGQRRQLGPHISLGGSRGNNRNLLRIYFLIDDESKFVVGHVGEHLD